MMRPIVSAASTVCMVERTRWPDSAACIAVSGEIDSDTAANAATNKHDFLVSLEHAVKHKDAIEREAVAAVEETTTADVPDLRGVGAA